MTLTQQEIIALAAEAGMSELLGPTSALLNSEIACLHRFYELAYQRGVRDERDACAKVCQENDVEIYRRKYRLCEPASDDCMHHGQAYAAAIRARTAE